MLRKTISEFLMVTLSVAMLCVLAILGTVVWIFVAASSVAVPVEFERLLEGSESIEIKSLKMVGHGQEILIDDEATTKYLNGTFRAAKREGYVPKHNHGYTYGAHIALSNGSGVTGAPQACNHC
jgi:hypothetical protein